MEEAADYRLLAIIYSAQGEHNKALESLVYANEIFVNFEQEVLLALFNTSSSATTFLSLFITLTSIILTVRDVLWQFDVATGNQSIGDELLALGRDSEAFVCFGKCVSDFKMLRGEHDALVAAAYTSLAELYLRTNNPKEAKVHCQLALQIYAKQGVGHVPGDVAYGLVNIASILVQLNEKETALLLLKRAYNIQDRLPGSNSLYTACSFSQAAHGSLFGLLFGLCASKRPYSCCFVCRSASHRSRARGPDWDPSEHAAAV
jgi:tetratricopeptide (TPR) repeat protein